MSPDGMYQLSVEVLEPGAIARFGHRRDHAAKGLDDLVAGSKPTPERAPEGAARRHSLPRRSHAERESRAPRDRARSIPTRDSRTALAVAAAVKDGEESVCEPTGDFKRHYLLQRRRRDHARTACTCRRPTTEREPIRSSSRCTESAAPRTISSAATTTSCPQLAEQHGYIVVAPSGYRVDGSYGWGLGNPPADPITRRLQERSEQDVMQVLQLVRQQYKIDDNRIYLMGHSMGAIGTWKIAPKYPDIWAAIAPISGSGFARRPGAHPSRSRDHRPRRRRRDRERAGIAQHGREDEGTRHRGDLHRGPRRESPQRHRSEPRRHLRVLHVAQEEGSRPRSSDLRNRGALSLTARQRDQARSRIASRTWPTAVAAASVALCCARSSCCVVLVAQVDEVDVADRHLVDRAVAAADPVASDRDCACSPAELSCHDVWCSTVPAGNTGGLA